MSLFIHTLGQIVNAASAPKPVVVPRYANPPIDFYRKIFKRLKGGGTTVDVVNKSKERYSDTYVRKHISVLRAKGYLVRSTKQGNTKKIAVWRWREPCEN